MLTSWRRNLTTRAFSLILPLLTVAAYAAEPVNTPGSKTPVLEGKPGVCFLEDKARELQNLVLVDLPACKRQSALKDALAEELQRALDASKLQSELLRRSLTYREQEAESLRKAIDKGTTTSRALWLGIGVVLGIATSIGVGYALKGAR